MELEESAGTISARQIRPLLDTLQNMGFAVEPMLAGCGLQRAMFDDPFARFPVRLEFELWHAIERFTGDPAIGLRIGRAFARRGQFEIDTYLTMNSGTLRRAVRNMQLVLRLIDDRGHMELSESGSVATVGIWRTGGHPRPPGWADALYAQGATLLFERIADFRLLGVELRRERPAEVAAYREVFGVVPSFGAAQNLVRFERALLDAPLRGSDVALGEVLLHLASQLAQNVSYVDPLLARIQNLLAEGFERGRAGLVSVARATGTSPRTLRRRLAELGTSFQSVLDGLRRDRAEHYLRHSDESIEAIAAKLGFASAGAFQRAFQRWHDAPPSAYRAQHRPAVRAASVPLGWARRGA